MRRPIASLALVLLLSSGAIASASDDTRSADAWGLVATATLTDAEGETTRVPLVIDSVDYEVELLGPLAYGTLVQHLSNPTEAAGTAEIGIGRWPAGLRRGEVEIAVDGSTIEQTADEKTADPRRRHRPEARRGPARAPDSATPLRTVAIEAKSSIVIRASFEAALPLRDGKFRLSLPAARRKSGGDSESGSGDVSRDAIGGRIQVVIRHDEPLVHVDSATHEILTRFEGDRTVVDLANLVEPRGREFILDYSPAKDDDHALTAYAGPEREGQRDLLVVFAPAIQPRRESIRPKQVLFVLDTSGSMSSGKLEQARGALGACLERLTDSDTYNVVEFDSRHTLLRPEPQAPAELPVDQAAAWMQALRAEGGTQLLPALDAALEQKQDAERHRMVVVLTDGNIQDEQPVLSLLQSKLGAGRLFVVGIGEDVRRETIQRLAEFGRGSAAFVDQPESLEAVLSDLFGSIASPLVWDLELDWNGAEAEIVGPHRLPDLYGGRAVAIRARVRGPLPGEISVRGQTMDGERVFSARIPEQALESLGRPLEREEEKATARPRATPPPSRSRR